MKERLVRSYTTRGTVIRMHSRTVAVNSGGSLLCSLHGLNQSDSVTGRQLELILTSDLKHQIADFSEKFYQHISWKQTASNEKVSERAYMARLRPDTLG